MDHITSRVTTLSKSDVENPVCTNVIYRTVSAISVSIPPVRHAFVTTVELKYLNCRHSNVRIGGTRDNNVTFYMGIHAATIRQTFSLSVIFWKFFMDYELNTHHMDCV